jgi:nucleoside-diphosphate-sugar epimerase
MRVFLAGATGVIGIRVLPLLVAAGHAVAGMSRSPGKVEQLAGMGAEPVVCDVYDLDALTAAVSAFRPDVVMHQLTDLPDTLAEWEENSAPNDRMRSEGTRNLIAAANAAHASGFVAQSIAWRPAGPRGEIVEDHERRVLAIGGVVARYGQLYGPGTYYEHQLPEPPRVQVDAAAEATPPLLGAPSGIVTIVET